MTHLDDVVLLMADTVRSRAYVDALAYAGYSFDRALIVRASVARRWGQATHVTVGNTDFGDLFVPDVNSSLDSGCQRICKDVEVLDTGSINTPEVINALQRISPKLVVFSGFGGELVRSGVLAASGSMLHLHAGWLPDFRGSTTLYYSFLAEETMGVSAILLSEEIDAGTIVLRKRYPAPPAGTNVDYVYDSVMRSDVLVEALSRYDSRQGCFSSTTGVDPEQGARTYYIIHPLLKHIALNKLNA